MQPSEPAGGDLTAKTKTTVIKYPYIKLLSNYKLTLEGQIQRAAISPNGRFALIPNKNNDYLYFITLIGRNPRLEDFRIPTGTAPADVVVSNNARRAYVANETDRTISIIRLDWDGSDIIATIPVDYSPTSLTISRDDKYLYVLSKSENMLMVLKLDDSDTQIVNNIKVGSWPVAIKVNDEAKLALVVNQGSNNISKIDISIPEGSLSSSNIPIRTYPCDVAINKNGTLAISTNLISDTLSLFDPTQSLIDSTFTISDMYRPAGIVTDITNGIAMLLNSEADRIKFYDLNTSNTSNLVKIRHEVGSSAMIIKGLFAIARAIATL